MVELIERLTISHLVAGFDERLSRSGTGFGTGADVFVLPDLSEAGASMQVWPWCAFFHITGRHVGIYFSYLM